MNLPLKSIDVRFARVQRWLLMALLCLISVAPALGQGDIEKPTAMSPQGAMTQTMLAQGAPAIDSIATTSNYPFIVLAIGIATVLGLIIGFRMNAFLALIIAALLVSLLVGGSPSARMDAVVSAFGRAAGDIGIVIAMAAIIGKCMLDSGAADRIVRTAVAMTGERKASFGLMASGFVLAIPVFFDTVFYLLVPLARSLYRRTGRNYLRYVMAIATGGAITHTLVPPTPGPLLVAATLGVDVGTMIFVGLMVAVPTALAGLAFSIFMDHRMPIAMRPVGSAAEKHEPLPIDQLPPLWLSLLPVFLPLCLIGLGTFAMSMADREDRAQITAGDLLDAEQLRSQLRAAASANSETPASRIVQSRSLPTGAYDIILSSEPLSEANLQELTAGLNNVLLARDLYTTTAFQNLSIPQVAKDLMAADPVRMKPVDRRRMNRLILEASFPDLIKPHQWDSPLRDFADRTKLWSNANFALILAGLVAIWTLKKIRKLTLRETADEVEESLMSGGVIILITAAGGAFGAMLRDAQIGDAIKTMFEGASAGGVALLLLGFLISAVLKIAQGSSTVAMIVSAGMISAIASGVSTGYHPVYLGLSVGCGSLFGSWMNDSGFWVFAKMGGLTEAEALKTWTVLLAIMSVVGLLFTVLLSQLFPMVG